MVCSARPLFCMGLNVNECRVCLLVLVMYVSFVIISHCCPKVCYRNSISCAQNSSKLCKLVLIVRNSRSVLSIAGRIFDTTWFLIEFPSNCFCQEKKQWENVTVSCSANFFFCISFFYTLSLSTFFFSAVADRLYLWRQINDERKRSKRFRNYSKIIRWKDWDLSAQFIRANLIRAHAIKIQLFSGKQSGFCWIGTRRAFSPIFVRKER